MELNDPVQRLCIAMEPGTYVWPHRHADPETWEVLTVLRGTLALNIFDDQGKVIERTVLRAGGPITMVESAWNTWHAPASLETGTVVFEVKNRGPIAHRGKQSGTLGSGGGHACGGELRRMVRSSKGGRQAAEGLTLSQLRFTVD